MAKEIREIIAMQEAVAAGDQARLAGLKRLRADVDYAESEGFLDASLPQAKPLTPTSEAVIPLPTKDQLREQLVLKEKDALSHFFGKDIVVPEPPVELLSTLERFEELRVTGFEPHFLPEVVLKEKSAFPGWKVKPEKWFWQRLKDGSIEKAAATLQEGWYLVDGRTKPNYNDGKQYYENDGVIQATIHELREAGKIQTLRSVPKDSRFGASPNEIEGIILPEFVRNTEAEGIVRNMRYIEFNVFGNIHHPEWGNTNTGQWFSDKFSDGGRLIGGGSVFGGLANVRDVWSDARFDGTGFSPAVEFPSQKTS